MVKDKWQCNPTIFNGEDSGGFLSCPQKTYLCSFCSREFNSAQALGGHMNVHRRDRARMKQLPPWLCQSSIPSSISNPNPKRYLSSSFPSPSSAKFSHCVCSHYSFHPPSLNTPSSPSYQDMKPPREKSPKTASFGLQFSEALSKEKSLKAVVDCLPQKQEHKLLKISSSVINLDLKMEMGYKDPQDGLDLELRLG